MEAESVYVYGIVDGKFNKEIESPGLAEGSKVYCIPFKDITAIVSDTPFLEYDPTEENSLTHEKVIQEILKAGLTIAPMRFCTVLKTKDDLWRLLHSGYLPFKRNILKIRGKQEFSVKVFLEVEKLKAEVNGGEELLRKSRELATELYERLKKVVEAQVLEEQITEDMILNASFLIRKDKFQDFYEEINDFDRRFTDKLKIRISGPTAPYNFVQMPIK